MEDLGQKRLVVDELGKKPGVNPGGRDGLLAHQRIKPTDLTQFGVAARFADERGGIREVEGKGGDEGVPHGDDGIIVASLLALMREHGDELIVLQGVEHRGKVWNIGGGLDLPPGDHK